MGEVSRATVATLQAIATIAPAIYTGTYTTPQAYLNHFLTMPPGFTFAYSHVAMPPLIAHAPPKLLAKQWLQAYEFAPVFVAPLILLGVSSNALLAFLSRASPSLAPSLYVAAALASASIIPYTALYMEPGVNGAGKWKVQELLRDEGFRLKGEGQGTDKDTASDAAKRWAEKVDMKTIVQTWATTNAWRYVITVVATIVSATATIMKG
jgi:hypothetical protein